MSMKLLTGLYFLTYILLHHQSGSGMILESQKWLTLCPLAHVSLSAVKHLIISSFIQQMLAHLGYSVRQLSLKERMV